jgi:hypothetical protein
MDFLYLLAILAAVELVLDAWMDQTKATFSFERLHLRIVCTTKGIMSDGF